MLILVMMVFLTIEIPLMVITSLHALSTSTNHLLDYELAGDIVLFINAFTCLACPLNFAIYCGMSKQFRETFYGLFTRPFLCCRTNHHFGLKRPQAFGLEIWDTAEAETRL